MKRFAGKKCAALAAGVLVAAGAGVAAPAPAQAACGYMNLGPDTADVWLNWGTAKTWTRVEPWGGSGSQWVKAVIVRYYGGVPRYYYGNAVKTQPVWTESPKNSYISANVGTWISNGFQWQPEAPDTAKLVREHAPRAGWTYGC